MRSGLLRPGQGIRRRSWGFLVAFAASAFVTPGPVFAERLPITHFSTADGLAHNRVARIVPDSHGFIWFCTPEGLSRFDGYAFVNYGMTHGLPYPAVNDLLETTHGYWIATNGGGVVRFDPAQPDQLQDGRSLRFTAYRVGDDAATDRVNVLYRDRTGRIWVGTDGGLFWLEGGADGAQFRPVRLGLRTHADRSIQVWAMLEDGDGSLWIGSRFGLLRRAPDGRIVQYTVDPRGSSDHVWAIVMDDEGRLWVGHNSGLIVFRPPPLQDATSSQRGVRPPVAAPIAPEPERPIVLAPVPTTHSISANLLKLPDAIGEVRRYTSAHGLPGNRVSSLVRSSSGAIWIGVPSGGLAEVRDGRFQTYAQAQGLSDNFILTLRGDSGGNIWVGTVNGVMRLARGGFVAYGGAEGLGQAAGSVFERDGAVYVISSDYLISRFDGRRFTTVKPRLPGRLTAWRADQSVLVDRTGEWWVATREGLWRFPRVSRLEQLAQASPKAVYTTRHGLADNDVGRLFEDRRGDIWVAHFAPGRDVLSRWNRAMNRFDRYSDADGLRPFNAPRAFAEDGAGNLWIGFRGGDLVRYAAGRFMVLVGASDGPPRNIVALHVDRAGRLWAAAHAWGLLRVDDLQADRPRVRTYTTAEGLSSNTVVCVTEDDRGYIYVGHGVGIDRLDPTTGRVRHYSAADGVINTEFQAAFRDSTGALWFTTTNGALRLVPGPDPPVSPPRIRIGGLHIPGGAQTISALGSGEVGPMVLGPGRNHVQIDFFGLSSDTGRALRYQYRLEGADRDWSAATTQRQVNYGSLAPGRYRFLVRALAADGTPSESPAMVRFAILPPLWQRWWFLALAVAAAASLAYIIQRSRLARLIELEQIRTRIATDLHDDIGSGLSQVALLSEIIGRRVGADPTVSEPLSTIAQVSRDLVDSMNDIVWAINPLRDQLSDLIHRMRRFASELLGARDVDLRFQADEGHDFGLRPDVRREMWLIFKESVNNIIRHSACTRVDIAVAARHGRFELRVSDNGKGFDLDSVSDGNGLASMRQRTARIGGTVALASAVGEGTTVTVTAPLGRQPWRVRSR